jgi:hypothetical protein
LPRRLVVLLTFLLAASVVGSAAAAEDTATPPKGAFQFAGRAAYVGGGAGLLTDIREPTENWSLMFTFPVARWLSVEANGFGFHFEAAGADPSQRSSTVALGIGTGLRIAAPPERAVRPYAAFRFQHIHMLFDPWVMPSGAHDHAHMTQEMDHTSMHRWGLGLGGGLEFRVSNRLRAGVELSSSFFTGQGTNSAMQGLASLGFGF